MTRDEQFNFGTRGSAAPDMELRSHAVRPLPHSRQPPVSVAPGLHHLRIDSYAIIAHQQAQAPGTVLQFDLYLSGMGVTERIGKRFASDS